MTKAKKPGTPVSNTLKRSISRNMQRGIWGSKRPRRSTGLCVGPSASMTGLDMTIVNPNGYSTMANGAWAWHCDPDNWFERWVPKPHKGESPIEWAIRVGVLCHFEDVHGGSSEDEQRAIVAAINAEFAHLDWAADSDT